MKDTISEYARLLIVLLCFGMLIVFVFSGRWFNILGDASNAMENKVTSNRQDAVFDELSTRQPPEIIASGTTAYVGQQIYLMHLNYTVAGVAPEPNAFDANGNSIRENIKVFCSSPDFDRETNTLTPSAPGVYIITYRVTDSYGLSAYKTINIVVN